MEETIVPDAAVYKRAFQSCNKCNVMKKQNPNNKLTFNKVVITELNDDQLSDVKGGTDTLIRTFIIATGYGSWLMVV
ncbi:MAG: class I lanthipeptide [Flavobacterium sp.]